MPNPLKPLDYQEVMDIWRKEKDLKSLAELRRDFFPEVKIFVSRLKEEAQVEAAKDPYSTKTRSLNGQVANVTEKVTQVFEIRMEKILRMAIRGASGGKVENTRMVEEEKAYFEHVFMLTKEIRAREIDPSKGQKDLEFQPLTLPSEGGDQGNPKSVIAGTEEPCATVAPKEQDIKPIAVEPAKPTTKEVIAHAIPQTSTTPPKSISPTLEEVEAKQEAKELLVLRILEDIPPFAGPFGNYRLRREDVATLPVGIARALIKRGKAVEIVVART
jgi:DNA replication initiation complex subunit (GINS family)